jgi:hypothetical protein
MQELPVHVCFHHWQIIVYIFLNSLDESCSHFLIPSFDPETTFPAYLYHQFSFQNMMVSLANATLICDLFNRTICPLSAVRDDAVRDDVSD